MSIRSVVVWLKRLFTLPRNRHSDSNELDLYREEFAPDDPVLMEIRKEILARKSRARGKPPRDSSAA